MTDETDDPEHTVHFVGGEAGITVRRNEAVLAAAVRAGVNVAYGCNSGRCGECVARLQGGKVKKILAHDYTLTRAEKEQGCFLMCAATPLSDLDIVANLSGQPQPRSLRARIRKLTKAGSSAPMIMSVRPQRSARLRFIAGQYVRVSFADYAPITCPVASCPCDERYLELHVFGQPDNEFRRWLFRDARLGQWVDVCGPFGRFVFSGDTARPVVLIAHTLGFAPVKSMLEHIIGQEKEFPIYLYRVAEPEYPHYLENLCRSWNDALDQLTVRDLSPDNAAATGVINNIVSNHPNLGDYDIYISAPPDYAGQWHRALVREGALPGRVFVEEVGDTMCATGVGDPLDAKNSRATGCEAVL